MEATYINYKNAVYFLPIVPDVLVYEATVLIGAIDDDGAACGVLVASEQPYGDNGEKVMNSKEKERIN